MILVATDFSSAGTRAIDLAARLARLRGSSLCLLHVLEPPPPAFAELAIDPTVQEDLRRHAKKQLAAAASSVRARGLSVEERLVYGAPAGSLIAEVAGQMKPELVVLGRHGRRGVPRLLMGSVAESALNAIQQPVLVVPDQGHDPAATAADHRWHVAVGIDASDSGGAVIDWVRELRATVACDVTFLHLYWPASEYARLGLLGPRDPFEADPTTVKLLETSLHRTIGTLPGTGETRLLIFPNWGSPGERLVHEAAEVGADLLVLGTHHRHGLSRLWHGATAPPAIHAAILPVLCVSQGRPAAPQAIPHLRRVLAATDLSDSSRRAVAHAYALARADRGSVQLLYVHERHLPRPAYAYAPGPEGALSAAEEADLRARLSAQIPPEAAALGVATEIIIVDGGNAAEVICQSAERLDSDAIVLGSHGRTGPRAVLGSVAGRVLHQARRPVFIVRHPAE